MGLGVRAAHGTFAAAAAAALASAAATVDIPEKLHLRATPILFHAVPISLPLPPLASLHDSSLFFPRLSSKDCSATPPLPAPSSSSSSSSSSSLASPCARDSYEFSLAQGAPRMMAHCLGVRAPFCFATSRLYSAPVTAKLGFRRIDASLQCVPYVESLLSTLLSFQPTSSVPVTDSESLHAWHVRKGRGEDGVVALGDEKKPVLTVVLLGWLGAQQKHLRKYAEWYNARGIHAVTFVIPMTDILSFKGQGNAEEHVDSLARHLVQWLNGQGEHAELEGEKQLIFHTFSNTGWLTYGAILEKMQNEGGSLVERIKGCVVDSAPVPDPDPQVWASGFSAALLKKRSSATKPALSEGEVKEGVTSSASSLGSVANLEVTGVNGLEAAVLSVLEGFFSLFLKLPAINQRLSEVVTVLQKKQPPCPQLYIYSTADKVIPVKAVEAFIEEQRKSGRVVRACNLQSSPHVDHFRSHPQLYSEQLINFLTEVLPSTNTQVHTL